MRAFCFTVDDNIRFFREITSHGCKSIFDHPYLAMYRRMHNDFGLKVQLNLFYEDEKFNLSEMPNRYCDEWSSVADWLKLSFHSRRENVRPYENSGYDEVFSDCNSVHREILRFAGAESLAKSTTLHYCRATSDGIRALYDCGIIGLLGLYGSPSSPRTSYQCTQGEANALRDGELVTSCGITYSAINIILNKERLRDIPRLIDELSQRERISLMIHEQYFYPDYKNYQSDFEEKLILAFKTAKALGYESAFFEEII